jgi:hypothetical protein
MIRITLGHNSSIENTLKNSTGNKKNPYNTESMGENRFPVEFSHRLVSGKKSMRLMNCGLSSITKKK